MRPADPARATAPTTARSTVAPSWLGPALLTISFGCLATSGFLGPSATEAPLGARDSSATPPWHVSLSPSPWLTSGLLLVAVVAGVAVLGLGLSGRWRPQARRLVVAGVLATAALALLPPIGSADPLSYAAYGRMVATGHDPWTTRPDQLAATDPVERAVEVPWQHTPSVYGPIATAEQAAASQIAGTDVALTVLLLDVVGAAVFVGAGLLLQRLATDETAKTRAALLWIANPLLWMQLVAGAHLDVLAAGGVLIALAVASRSRLAGGAAAGVAASVKAPAGLVWAALAWVHRQSRRALAELAIGALVVAGTGYAVAGVGIVHQLSRASRLISLGTPWRPVADVTDPAIGHGASRQLIGALAFALFLLVFVALRRFSPQIRSGPPAALSFGLFFAYVLAAPYALPWYDAVPWVLLPLLAASSLDRLLIAHTTVLSLAYLPGRAAYPLSGSLRGITVHMRDTVSPICLTAIVLTVLVSWRRHAARPADLRETGDVL